MNATSTMIHKPSELYTEMVERARKLVPALKAAADESDELRRTPDHIVEELKESGLFRVVQPRRIGGYELPATIYFDALSELGRGCASVAWIVGNLAAHNQQLALWPRQAQDEVWGESGETLVGSSFVFPAGKARAVDGGYLVQGQWPFSSGIHPCSWVALGGLVKDDSGRVLEQRLFLLPREEYEIVATWDVAGLRGTGSDDVRVDDVFVPEHRTVSFDDVANGTAPGLALETAPLFRLPMFALGGWTIVPAIYGAARGALDVYVEKTKAGAKSPSGVDFSGQGLAHEHIGRAAAMLDTVELIARHRLAQLMEVVTADIDVPPELLVVNRRDASYCAQLSCDAVDIVFAASGGSALYLKNPVQRAWRDAHAGAAHMSLRWDLVGPAYGRVQTGLPSGLPGIGV